MQRINVGQAADLAGADRKTVKKLISENGIKSFGRDGRNGEVYDSTELLMLKAPHGNSKRAKLLDLNEESARLKKAQADKTEMEIAEKEGRLVDADQVADAFAKMIMECRAKLLTLPKKLALVVAPDNLSEAEAEAERLVFEALEELGGDRAETQG